ncbi:MAG: uroporphyrinogen-III synthase [Elusimicrobia bacterium]|nr:uroporphyrinogen-III synthase [Elusimicrobiota bacterium]
MRPYSKRPLCGKKIVLTRPRKQSAELAQRLKRLGASVYSLPTIRIQPAQDNRLLKQAVSHLNTYDLLIFTSPNGAHAFFKHTRSPIPSHIKICAIGPKTAQTIRSYGAKVHLIPQEFKAEALAQSLKNVKGKKILIPRAKKARQALPRSLRRKGAKVEVVEAYQTLPEKNGSLKLKQNLLNQSIHAITFTSSSTVRNFVSLFQKPQIQKVFSKCLAVSIGPITTQTLKRCGIRPILQAKEYTSGGIVKALLKYYAT